MTSCHYYIITFFVLTLLACTYYVWWCVWNRVQQLFEYGIPFFLFLKNRKLIRQRIFLNIKIWTQSENVCPYIHEIYMGVCVFLCVGFLLFLYHMTVWGATVRIRRSLFDLLPISIRHKLIDLIRFIILQFSPTSYLLV